MSKHILEKIGFLGHEKEIYLALLEAGSFSVSELVRKTGIHRPTVYKTLALLIDKGLVRVMPVGKYKKYVAESPEHLETIFKELEADFTSEIFDLKDMYESRDKKPRVTFAEGSKGITQVFSDVVHRLKKGEMYLRYSSQKELDVKTFVPKDYREVRDRKGLERLIITNEPTKKRHSKKLGREIKVIPPDFDLFEYNISQIIYADRVAFVDYNTKTSITIENPIFAEFQRKIFKLLFKKL